MRWMTLLILLMPPCSAQSNKGQPKPAASSGECSPVNTGDHNVFTMNCGIGQEQGKELLKIINKLLVDQKDLKAVSGKIDEIMVGIRQILQTTAVRRLTTEQKAALIQVMKEFAGQKITIFCILGDGESRTLANDFLEVFRQAGWTGSDGRHLDICPGAPLRDEIGVSIIVNQTDADANQVPLGAVALMRVLKPSGLLTTYAPQIGVGKSEIAFIVGRKPPVQ